MYFTTCHQILVNKIYFSSGPGTSLRRPPGTASHGISQGIRPLSQSGRPLSGFIRPGTQSSRPKTMEQAIMTPRTAMTARYTYTVVTTYLITSFVCACLPLPGHVCIGREIVDRDSCNDRQV